jgi:hypothetical protein
MAEFDRTRKPQLTADDMDRLARQNAQLMAELWIVKDRMAILEKLLEESGVLDRAALNRNVPEGDFAAELAHERDAFVARIVDDAPENRSVETLKARANPHTP